MIFFILDGREDYHPTYYLYIFLTNTLLFFVDVEELSARLSLMAATSAEKCEFLEDDGAGFAAGSTGDPNYLNTRCVYLEQLLSGKSINKTARKNRKHVPETVLMRRRHNWRRLVVLALVSPLHHPLFVTLLETQLSTISINLHSFSFNLGTFPQRI